MVREDFKITETISPGEDFYLYANKYWIDNNPMPSDKSRYASFDKLHEENLERLMKLVEKPSANLPIKLQMDIINLRDKYLKRDYAENLVYISKFLGKIEQCHSLEESMDEHISLITKGVRFFFEVSLDSDLKDCDNNIIYISQSGISINKDYYEDEEIMEKFQRYVTKLIGSISKINLDLRVSSILNLEKNLAKVSSTETQMRDTEMSYNIYSLDTLLETYKNIPWVKVFNEYNFDTNDIGKICICQPDFIKGLDEIFKSFRETIQGSFDYRTYLMYCVLDTFSPHLGEKFYENYFEFYSKTLCGQDTPEPLEKRAYYFTASIYKEAIGKKYVENYYDEGSKFYVDNLVYNLKKSFRKRIKEQNWLSDETKEKALEKLDKFKTKIGYPKKLKEYEWISFNNQDCFLKILMDITHQNILHETETKFRKPVDKDEWYMAPQTVNAYYNPTSNEICFPAGILQFPFFDKSISGSWNYGAIGAIIAHEMTHGFDDQGRLFDGKGDMVSWWKSEDSKKFNEITSKFVDFFGKIEIMPGLFANGELTLGENLADHGGVRIALQALKDYQNSADLKEFFLGFAAGWAGSIKEEEIKRRTIEDVHSLGTVRVNACLPHFNEWYEAFGIKEGDKLFIPEEERLSIW